jgi:hypothetical protein
MSRLTMNRRKFLTLPLGILVGPLLGKRGHGHAGVATRQAKYDVEASLLYGTIRLGMTGTMEETIDREAARYAVRLEGEGSGVANRVESTGFLRGGRWAPLRASSWFNVRGRESRSELTYDYDRRTVEYHYRGETFFLRRLRVADDVLALPESLHVDDVISATLNYAQNQWPVQPDGGYETRVVRRRRNENEGPDDVEKAYRAELVPFVVRVVTEEATGRPTAVFDLTRFSSWATTAKPARIVFGADRRPETITASLVLGTSVTIHFKNA